MDVQDASQQYGQIIVAQRDNLAKASLRRGERPTNLKSKEELYSAIMMSILVDKMQPKMGGNYLVTSFVPPAYPPCAAPLSSLQPIKIRELQLETHHRGRYLLLRTITPPKRLAGILVAAVDTEGDAVQFQLYQQDDEEIRTAENIMSQGSLWLVKEPFFKCVSDGGYGIRVDHLSDATKVEDDHEIVSEARGPPLRTHDIIAPQANDLKEQGNRDMRQGNHWEAINAYTKALSRATYEIDIIKRNRALAYLKTQQYDAALVDTGYPNIHSRCDEKSLFRAAEALYNLQRFEDCLHVTELLIESFPDNVQAKVVLKRTKSRIREAKEGKYDFANLQKLAKQVRPPLMDCATYIGPIEVKETAGKGRGVFLTKDVKAGDLLLCEKAFEYAHVDEQSTKMKLLLNVQTQRATRGGSANLITQVAHKMHRNPSLAPEITSLYRGDYRSVDLVEVDGQPIVDTFLVETAVSYNVFGCCVSTLDYHKDLVSPLETKDKLNHSSGLWIKASYINHSCFCNARRAFIGDMMVVRASQDLAAGTEIVWWYHCPMVTDPAKMHEQLQHWGFSCDCALCVDIRATSTSTIQKRESLAAKIKAQYAQVVDDKIVRRVAALTKALEQTYAHSAVEVPRVALWEPNFRIASAFYNSKKMVLSLEWNTKAFGSLGFIVKGLDNSSTAFSIVKWGLAADSLAHMLMQVKGAFAYLGLVKKANAAEAYARVTFKILVGEDSSFSKIYN